MVELQPTDLDYSSIYFGYLWLSLKSYPKPLNSRVEESWAPRLGHPRNVPWNLTIFRCFGAPQVLPSVVSYGTALSCTGWQAAIPLLQDVLPNACAAGEVLENSHEFIIPNKWRFIYIYIFIAHKSGGS